MYRTPIKLSNRKLSNYIDKQFINLSSINPKCVSLSDSDEARIGIVSKTSILDAKTYSRYTFLTPVPIPIGIRTCD